MRTTGCTALNIQPCLLQELMSLFRGTWRQNVLLLFMVSFPLSYSLRTWQHQPSVVSLRTMPFHSRFLLPEHIPASSACLYEEGQGQLACKSVLVIMCTCWCDRLRKTERGRPHCSGPLTASVKSPS